MPRNQFQRMIFALLTVIITVHGYVFYSLYVVNGKLLMDITGAGSVLEAIKAQGGVYMFGRMLAFFSQVFFIQPFVRWAFGKLFAKDIAARNKQASVERPKDETEAIADIFKRKALKQRK